MFTITTDHLKLQLEVVPVESLLRHEKILPHVLDRLILEFKNWVNLLDPIIVDKNNIVLDGNHRALAFRALDFRYIAVCKIDYFNENTGLKYWFRLLENIESIDLVQEIVERMGGSFEYAKDKEHLKRHLEENRLRFAIHYGSTYTIMSFEKDIVGDAVNAYDILERIQTDLIKFGIDMKYIPCQTVCEENFYDELRPGQLVIWTPRITKGMVVEAAGKNRLFAPKTTRHVIPARPLNVNVPVHWFKEDISLESINRKFSEFLKRKRLKRFGPGQVIHGRYYGEELFIFSERKVF